MYLTQFCFRVPKDLRRSLPKNTIGWRMTAPFPRVGNQQSFRWTHLAKWCPANGSWLLMESKIVLTWLFWYCNSEIVLFLTLTLDLDNFFLLLRIMKYESFKIKGNFTFLDTVLQELMLSDTSSRKEFIQRKTWRSWKLVWFRYIIVHIWTIL